MKMRGLMLISASFALTFAIVTNAWLQKKQFYPTVVYLTKSSPCIAALYVQAFVFVLLFAKLVRKIFFGQLRPAETEHLIERSWYAVTDTCLAFTMFRDDFSPVFVGAFTLLLFLKSFHWLLEDRVDFMERSPRITYIFKLRVLSLLVILLMCDLSFVNLSYNSIMTKGPSVQIVFGFEYAILVTIVLTVFLKYVLHTIDLQSENPWENKVLYMLYVEIVTGFFRVLLYICFTILMVKVHTFPLFSIRPMYLTMRQFKKAISDIVLSRRAIQNMNNLYPDATAEELSNADSTCIICREEMNPPNDTPVVRGVSDAGVNKKLPCGHIFHASCLRSWFQRQQTCPTCRLDVLQTRNPIAAGDEQRPPAAPDAAPNLPPPPFAPQMFPHAHPPMFPGYPPPPAPIPGPHTDNKPGSSQTTRPPFAFPPPPFPSMMGVPSFYPPPIPPPHFSELSDEQLREMEGLERRNVESRIECLRNINLLLDAAMMQISQYMQVAPNNPARFHLPTFPPPAQTTTTNPTSSSFSATMTAESLGAVPSTPPDAACSTGDADSTAESASVTPDADELRRRRLAKLSSGSNDGDRSAEVS